ncbi:lycopene cyclase domain-containing protein [Amnibacterium kyonggiense]
MTTYLLLAAGVAVPVSIAALVVLARAGRRVLVAALVALVVLVALTVVFDNVIVGSGVVAYDPTRILGLRVGVAPIEDFSYCVVAALALPALWVLLGRRRSEP